MADWALVMGKSGLTRLGRFRFAGRLEILEDGERFWLRGEGTLEDLPDAMTLPFDDRFEIREDGLLCRPGRLLPAGRLPEGAWTPLARWFSPSFPQAGSPPVIVDQIVLSVVRGGEPNPAGLLLTSLEVWKGYALEAPLARLEPLFFALGPDERVVIKGDPLPPIPGELFTLDAGVALPCGYRVDPPIDASIVARICGLAQGEVALFDRKGEVEILRATDFVAARRSAVRCSPEEKHAG